MQSSQLLKSKIRQLKQKEGKKSKQPSDESLTNSAVPSPMDVTPLDGLDNKDDLSTGEAIQEGQSPLEGKRRKKVSRKKDQKAELDEKVAIN